MQAVLGYVEHVDMPLCGNRGKLPSLRERVDAPLRGSRGGPSKTVDEDVGSRFVGKHFGVRLFEGVCHSIVGRESREANSFPYEVAHGFGMHRESRAIKDRPYGLAGSRKVCGKGIVPRGLSGRPVPTSLCEFYYLCADGMKSRIAGHS